ncbi:hypothetical protein SCP_1303170 [Sparassis crispa]|uniref:Uncharacterized protein n=1 Tax=Sparassis crispa TaxID=139825 RepID=A0A401H240_9APHY|nr:hypothetical protein SCP_1303170 [Sparassis crispa]GBE88501.1 hypothetical protein SCP_1303170 [Sparassis crispa]
MTLIVGHNASLRYRESVVLNQQMPQLFADEITTSHHSMIRVVSAFLHLTVADASVHIRSALLLIHQIGGYAQHHDPQ